MDKGNMLDAAAVVVAVFAFIGTAIQARVAWVQNRLSVRPFLHVYPAMLEPGFLEYRIDNSGVGPALISDYCVIYKNHEHRGVEIITLMEQHFKAPTQYAFFPKSAIRAHDSVTILKFPIAVQPKEYGELQKYMDSNFELRIKYQSFFGDVWTYSSKDHD